MRLFVVLPRLDGGGMERMRLHLLQEFLAAGVEVFLVVGQLRGELVPLVPDNVSLLEIAPKGPLFFLPGLLRAIKTYRPTHILSAADDVNCLAIWANKMARIGARIVVSNHNTLSRQMGRARGLDRWKLIAIRAAMRRIYPLANQIVAVSEGVADDLASELKIARSRVNVVYNPVVNEDFQRRSMDPAPQFWADRGQPVILYVGRLTPEKRLDLLVEAFARVLIRKTARLLVAGIGPMQDWLQQQISLNGWEDRMKLCGFVSNVLPIIREADMLVLPSDHEGLPNVLVEALACGTQVVATDCPSGPAEILERGRWGRLVPVGDAAALAQAILEVLEMRIHIEPALLKLRASAFNASKSASAYLRLLTGDPSHLPDERCGPQSL